MQFSPKTRILQEHEKTRKAVRRWRREPQEAVPRQGQRTPLPPTPTPAPGLGLAPLHALRLGCMLPVTGSALAALSCHHRDKAELEISRRELPVMQEVTWLLFQECLQRQDDLCTFLAGSPSAAKGTPFKVAGARAAVRARPGLLQGAPHCRVPSTRPPCHPEKLWLAQSDTGS